MKFFNNYLPFKKEYFCDDPINKVLYPDNRTSSPNKFVLITSSVSFLYHSYKILYFLL